MCITVYGSAEEWGVCVFVCVGCICVKCEVCEGRERGVLCSAGWHVMGDGCGIAVQASGATPVYLASQNGHLEAVRALIGAGAALNQAAVSGYHSVW